MNTVCTLIEYRNGSREILFVEEKVKPNFFIKEWNYIELTVPQLEEIKNASTDKVQEILSKLYK